MTDPELLRTLSGLHEMMVDLLQRVPAQEVNRRFDPALASLAWYLGRSVYRELYWLREILAQDGDLSGRVRHLFEPGDWETQCAQLPPPEHLLGWSTEIWGEHLRRLATPGALPEDPRLEQDRLPWFLVQETARDYETMVRVLVARRLQQSRTDFVVRTPLRPQLPEARTQEVLQGHYRIGSRYEPFAYDRELPPQVVELSAFRIATEPVSNAEYLAFMEAGGYEREEFWEAAGWRWLQQHPVSHPWHWRRDRNGHWYEVGVNGPMALVPREPLSGISQYEARAYAAWVAQLGGARSGAVVQHEYQWEAAARSGKLTGTGRVWEWCKNPLHPYPEFSPFPDARVSQVHFQDGSQSLRGASLHTQPPLRRTSARAFAQAQERHHQAGLRLVFPPE